jgi:hypothetical protein
MKTGLQKAALARLARLTQHPQLPANAQTQLRERLLKRCAEPKKALPNGVNGVNGLGSPGRIIVYSLHFEITKLLALISDQATTEYNSLLALTEMWIDETTAQSLFHIVAQHLSECCGYRFAVGCSINGISSSANLADHCDIDLEDPPSRQLAYSLTKTLIRISTTLPILEKQAESVFLDHLEKVGAAFSSAIARQGLSVQRNSNW